MTSQDFRKLSVLLESIGNGSRDSFAQIYRMYEKKAYFLFCKLVGNKAEASKLTIDLFDCIYLQISNFSDPTEFEKWLYITLFSKAKKSAAVFGNENDEEFIDAETEEALEIDELLIQDSEEMLSYPDGINISVDMMKTTDRVISQLPFKLRIAVLGYYFCGFDAGDISAIEQITEKEVKNRLFKARLRMKTEEHKFTELGYDCAGLVVFLPDVLSIMAQNIVMAANIASGVTGRTGIPCTEGNRRVSTAVSRQTAQIPGKNSRPTAYAVAEPSKQKPLENLSPAIKVMMGIVATLIIVGATVAVVFAVQGAKKNTEGSVGDLPDTEVQTTMEFTWKEATTQQETTTVPETTTEQETTTEEVTTVPENTTVPETTTQGEYGSDFNYDVG